MTGLSAPGLSVQRRPADVAGAPLVVLVHGAMDRAAGFANAARSLRDLEVVRYDRRGYGRSRAAGTATTLDQLVDDLFSVTDGRRAIVVGHSIGGTIALAAAAWRPQLVAAVGAFEPPMPWQPWWPSRTAGSAARAAAGESPEAAAEAFMRRMIGDRRWEELPERTREQRRSEGEALLADLGALRVPSAPFDPAAITVPAVVGRGSETDERHRRTVDELAVTIPGCERIEIEGAPHGAHHSHPIEYARFVRRVVERSA